MGKKIVLEKQKTATGYDEIYHKVDLTQIANSFGFEIGENDNNISIDFKPGINNVFIYISNTLAILTQGYLLINIDHSKINNFTQNIFISCNTETSFPIYFLPQAENTMINGYENINSVIISSGNTHISILPLKNGNFQCLYIKKEGTFHDN